MDDFATGPDGLIRTADFIRAGRNDRELRRAATAGELVTVIPGVFVRADRWQAATGPDRHVLRAMAFAPRLDERAVFSHTTATALHGWGSLGPPPDLLDVSDPDLSKSRRLASARLHVARLSGADLGVVEGLPVTSPARTAVDMVVSQGFRAAVVALDSALHVEVESRDPRRRRPLTASLLTLDDFDAALGRRLPVRGHKHVQRVRAFANGLAASGGESLSRIVMHERGWPAPTLQQPFFVGREHIGDVDFWWEEFGVIGEFDGFVKYSRQEHLGGMSPADAAVKEKRREDLLRAHPAVRGFARWMWSDVMHPPRLDAILGRTGLWRSG
ncbi:hypothetical protein AX769_10195 [Frondihabitans sp. PAMC 28766]|uniref:type IV toxin-antitoxin system AbiEi family antitoxin domain-containing protein n=1 Tax=Frondihabitans sp. PAMC 28766 TaxID=1795630 RepID=UPI00078C901B|nr:type IV toxin-antitoxin system AbiEi family antitoxin domain-containing protein [Frondihabitans sp. PAMC 28766]AMM20450.1 hypothetical protein AX769_10195 [Frondihabitans sp. PAMC 28766]